MLKDLKELLESSQARIKDSLNNISDIKFSSFFKKYYNENVDKNAVFLESTVIIHGATKDIIAPSLWFFIAAHLTEISEELERYKNSVIRIIREIDFRHDFERWTDEIRKEQRYIDQAFVQKSIEIFGEDDTNKIKTFLSDYSYWGGGKSIGRKQNDFAHSVLLKAARLTNETSGAVVWFTDTLRKHPELGEDILQNAEFRQVQLEGQVDFDIETFRNNLSESGIYLKSQLVSRFVSSLTTKPFIILSGLSGSGKTKLAQAFAQWICQDDNQYCIVPVGADWTNREPLLGYPNALKIDEYIKPDNGALDVIINANDNPDLPYFLILDEMNLSHVERYFADFLSVMESGGEIALYSEGTVENGVPAKLRLPSNLFIIGTVNIDETTYMFSPKVLDRANAIEFRVTKDEIESFFADRKEVDMSKLMHQGASMAKSFLELADNTDFEDQDLTETHKTLVNFFEQLQKTGAEFGYRSATEIIRLINQLSVIDPNLSPDEKLDIAIMQKLLPKLHGSRRKLCPVLITIGNFCVKTDEIDSVDKKVFADEDFDFNSEGVKYPLSLEKITRMYRGAIDNGFASYAEA